MIYSTSMAIRPARNKIVKTTREKVARAREPRMKVRVYSPDEAWALYNERAQTLLGMSAEEFEHAWERGEFLGRQEETAVRRVRMIQSHKPTE